jgi:hypothetical protein
MRPASSTTISRPPMWIAAVAATLPRSSSASLVVPPPMSMLRMRAARWWDALAAPRAVGGEHRLHVVAGGRADELAAELGEELADRLGVLAPQRFAGEDHRAGIDVVRMQPGAGVGGVDDRADRALVDAALVEVRRQRNRRLVQRLAVHDEIAALQVLAEAPHVQPREDHLRARRADVDADARQRDVVVDPERVRLGRARRELVVVVIVVVVRILVVTVLEVGAVQMVLQRVPGLASTARRPGSLAE